jgi:hypothetical protein
MWGEIKMNKNINKELRQILDSLEEIREHLEDIVERSEDMRDNISDEFQDSEVYIKADDFVEDITNALSNLEMTIDSLEMVTD